jgi:hypothetical protein
LLQQVYVTNNFQSCTFPAASWCRWSHFLRSCLDSWLGVSRKRNHNLTNLNLLNQTRRPQDLQVHQCYTANGFLFHPESPIEWFAKQGRR